MLQRLFSRNSDTAPHEPSSVLRAAIVFALLLATAMATWQTYRATVTHQQSRFDYEVRRIDSAVEQRMIAYVQVLLGGQGLFAASDDVTRADWQRYVETLRLSQRYPGFKSLSFAAAVAPEDLAAFVARVQAEPLPPGMVNPSLLKEYRLRSPAASGSAPPVHSPILYVAPFSPENQRVLGIDMMQEPMRRAAMERAAATNSAVLSPKIRLAEQKNAEAGFIAYLPIPREDKLLGWLTAAFRAEDFMRGLLDEGETPLSFEIHDGLTADDDSLLYSTAGLNEDRSPRALTLDASPPFTQLSRVDMPGRQWTIRYVATPDFIPTTDRLLPWLVALGGLLATLLFYAIARAGAHWQKQAAMLSRQAQALQQVEAAVRHQATHDPLTGLANRALFMDRLQTALERARRRNQNFALAYIDIDGFKPVNDNHGHHVGDELLRAIAERLRGQLRKEDTVARLGGDEFALILEESAEPPTVALRLCSDVIAKLREPFDITTRSGRITVHIGASAGLSLYPIHGEASDTLINAADDAMYRAKQSGKNRCLIAENPG